MGLVTNAEIVFRNLYLVIKLLGGYILVVATLNKFNYYDVVSKEVDESRNEAVS
jgi:hypothetical protein